MSRLYYSVIVLLLSIGIYNFTFADQQSSSVSAILESYANVFSNKPDNEQHFSTTQLNNFPNFKIDNFNYSYPRELNETNNNSTTKTYAPIKRSYSNDELQTADSKISEIEANDNSSSIEAESEEDPKGPPDHVIPYSEHENPKEPSTKPNYTAPGDWAKPPPDKNIPLDFVPTKIYAQVRGTHTIKRVPREDAVKSAETDEEKENAARLKEVVKVTKANTVYTEEGYEDAAYDHAGHIRDANFHEGFAKKLNENVERKVGGGKRRSKRLKIKNDEASNLENFDDDYNDHATEVVEEARSFKQQVKPENLEILKNAFNTSIINPKSVAEDGIIQLESDLKKEYSEARSTSTELYYTTPLSTSTISKTGSINQNKPDHETTTIRSNVFTVRPQKTTTLKLPTYSAKIKIPNKYNPISKRNDDYNVYTSHSYEDASTDANSQQDWRPIINKRYPTSTMTYQPVSTELQSTSPVVSNPLAVATVNGHGPYIVMVTSPPSTYIPISEEQDSDTVIPDIDHSRNGSYFFDYHVEHKPFVTPKYKIFNRHSTPRYSHVPNNHNPMIDEDRDNQINDRNFKYSKFTIIKPINKTKTFDYTKMAQQLNPFNYFTMMQPPKMSNPLIIYPKYRIIPYNNDWEDRPKKYVIEKIPKNSFKTIKVAESSRNNVGILMTPPETKLLPPAPLSVSEYTSFLMHDKKNDPALQSVMTIMPVIKAIQNQENKLLSSLFPFRKKRSAAEYYKKLSDSDILKNKNKGQLNKIDRIDNNKNKKTLSNKKYSSKFNYLLNQSPKIANKIVNYEIQQRFKNNLENSSQNLSNHKPENIGILNEESNEKFKDSSNEKSSSEDSSTNNKSEEQNNTVQVEVPEFQFNDEFTEDEITTTTKKPSIDIRKYPFYKNPIMDNSAIKYMVNPLDIPHKTLGGMEFYNSRNLQCDEEDPNLEKIVPENKELENKRGPQNKDRRLQGLGDKLDCYKAKYFDKDPLDNPLFLEKDIRMPSLPSELNPQNFGKKILRLPSEKSEYVISKNSRTPEKLDPMKYSGSKNIPRLYVPRKKNNHNYQPRPQKSQSMYTNKHKDSIYYEDLEMNRTPMKPKRRPSHLKVSPSYQHHVYEDVMGTIKDLEKNRRKGGTKRYPISTTSENYPKNYKKQSKKTMKKKFMQSDIRGLVPPPETSKNLFVYKNNKKNFGKPRYYQDEEPVSNSRIMKRNVNVNDEKEIKAEANQNNQTSNKFSEKTNFTIIVTTSAPKIRQINKKYTTPNIETTQSTTFETINYSKYPDRQSEDVGRYGKFLDEKNFNLTNNSRRGEPTYNNSQKRKTIKKTDPNFLKSNVSLINSEFKKDLNISGSTLIPVVVKFDEQSNSKLPQESKIKYSKLKLKNNNLNEKSNILSKGNKNSGKVRNAKSQYLVKESNEENDKYPQKDNNITDIADEIDSKEHRSLKEFLKGDPPGYEKAFAEDNVHSNEKNQDNKAGETKQNNELKDDSSSDEKDSSTEKSINKEASEEESSSEDEPDETSNNKESESEEENSSTNSNESNDKPFERFSDRPYSPPENYEDERYSHLGPRVNKPFFYHPPFDPPKYEIQNLRKDIDDSDEDHDDWAHSEETKNHEKSIFPWENDDDDESSEEAEYQSKLGRYEYPWERRDRKNRERKKREKLRKKYGKHYYYFIDDNDDDDENQREATHTKLTYLPVENKRGKKDDKQNSSSVVHTGKISEFLIPKNVNGIDNKNITIESFDKLTNNKNNLTTPKSFQATSTLSIKPNATSEHSPRLRIRKSNVTNYINESKQVSSTPNLLQKRGRQRNNFRTTPTTSSPASFTIPNKRRRNWLTSSTVQSIVPISRTIDRHRRLAHSQKITTARNLRRNNHRGKVTTLPSASTSTEKTIEHHSRISRKQTITKTFYHDEQDDDDDDLKNEKQTNNADINGNRNSKKDSENNNNNNTLPKEKVEKITITMEETPDRVYRTEEIDRDGVKGKFVTIIANNHTNKLANRTDDFGINDEDDIEKLKNSKDTFSTYGSTIRDDVDLIDEPSGFHDIKNYNFKNPNNLSLSARNKTSNDPQIDYSLLRHQLHKPNNTDDKISTKKNKVHESRRNIDDNDNDDDDDVDENDEESNEDSSKDSNDDSNESDENSDEDNNEDSVSHYNDDKINDKESKNFTFRSLPKKIIKDPSKRQYFYVE